MKVSNITAVVATLIAIASLAFAYKQSLRQEFSDVKTLDMQVQSLIHKIDNKADIEKIENINIPKGAVVAFDTKECPTGWSEYVQAYGRFIRGIDRSGGKIDPDGERLPGKIQGDLFKSHNHSASGTKGTHKNGSDGSGERVTNSATVDSSSSGGNETRPKNVALLYCKKGK